MKVAILFCLSLIIYGFGFSQLTIPQIMQGEEFVGYLPEDLRMMPNDVPVFSWKQKNDEKRTLYKIQSGKPVALSDQEKLTYPLNGFEWNSDKSIAAYSNKGNLFIWDTKFDSPRPLIVNDGHIHHVGWSGDLIYFTQDQNVYQYSSSKGVLIQLTNFKNGQSPSDQKTDFLEKQQENLFEFIKSTEEEKYMNLLPKPVYISDRSIQEAKLSPNGEIITYVTLEKAGVQYTKVQHHITPSGYTKNTEARPKVGRAEDVYEFFVYHLEKQESTTIDFSTLTHLNQIPFYYSEYDKGHEEYQNKGLVFHGPYYNPAGTRSILEIKSLDNKHRWIVALDLENNTFKEIEYQHDAAWIGGPGISGWNEEPGNIDWLNNDIFYFQSEESGYAHLYTYDFKKGKKLQLTTGEYEIHQTFKTNNPLELLVVANKKHPGNREVYRMNVNDKLMTPVLTQEGKYDPVFTSDFASCYYLYSFKNKPTELYQKQMGSKGQEVQLTESKTAAFKAYDWYAPEVVTFMSVDALYDVYARLYKPEEAKKNGAGVIFVHGAGYLQNAHNYWSLYYREYMFHNFLRDQGYTILDIDYRASEGYGRDWRTAIYRHMGGKDLLDQLGGRDYLINELGIDEGRIGIYGGSYGGFITLMALLTEPGKFACGAALRSVTDWAHYNHEYTSNILNTPEEDSVAYFRSSPINFAENLEDPLIMLHGMVDDNVQFQDVVRLSQRFIELGKQDWEMAVYPVEPHGFKTASSWTDEYTRIYKLFETYLK